MADAEPLIRLDPGGQAPVLSYNLPEPTVYTGRNFIELPYEEDTYLLADAAEDGTYGVRLRRVGDNKVAVIKVVRSLTGMGLKDAKTLVETSRPTVLQDVSRDVARAARSRLEEAGARVSVSRPRRPEDRNSERLEGEVRADQKAEAAGEEAVRQASRPHDEVVAEIRQAMRSGFADRKIFPAANIGSGSVRLEEATDGGPARVVSTMKASDQLAKLDAEEIASRKASGQELVFYKSMAGQLRYRFARRRGRRPRLLLVETYRLATHLGAYGAGPVIKTFSLLPGERTKIEIRTFRKSETERAETSSILDSFSEESAIDFEQTIASEQSDRVGFEESFSYTAEAEASASWGWGSASASGGAKGGTNATREQAAKNTTSATNKHAQKASAKRQVEIDTSRESRETREEERTTAREIENINVSRTLNFVFRQMNQQYLTVLSLVDVRVAYFDGTRDSADEVPLAELDDLLERHVVDDEHDRVRSDVHDALTNIVDFSGKVQRDFVEERDVGGETFLRVRSERTSTYTDANATAIEVPGIILSVTENVMRTDGVIVEALLGVGEALDTYSSRLQALEIDQRAAAAGRDAALADRESLANESVRNNDGERAALLKDIATAPGRDAPLEIAIRQRDGQDNEPQE